MFRSPSPISATEAEHRRRGGGALAVAWALACAVVAGGAGAQTVALGGSFGDKGLLVIDGTPRSVAVGATVQGVRLVSVSSAEAVVEVKGKRYTLASGAPLSLGGAASAGNGSRIVLSAESGGHFVSAGAINGKSVRFLVDTGATNVGMSQSEADRLGIDWRAGQRSYSITANGAVPVHLVSLASVRLGDVTVYDVAATVLPSAMSYVLLGNSFLTRFQMKRENDQLTLDKRF